MDSKFEVLKYEDIGYTGKWFNHSAEGKADIKPSIGNKYGDGFYLSTESQTYSGRGIKTVWYIDPNAIVIYVDARNSAEIGKFIAEVNFSGGMNAFVKKHGASAIMIPHYADLNEFELVIKDLSIINKVNESKMSLRKLSRIIRESISISGEKQLSILFDELESVVDKIDVSTFEDGLNELGEPSLEQATEARQMFDAYRKKMEEKLRNLDSSVKEFELKVKEH